ncbi:MAG: hypothetical protein K2L54_05730, partial [Clostridiales bacterium]|nr:hypothetical protein [Clostridiales bacterium]
IKQYDGKAWALSSDSMTVTNVNVIDGGNGYRYSARVMPQDVGTYTVTVKCNDGYEWSDAAENASAERTFTLEITPVSVKLEWYYMFGGEQNRDTRVTGDVPEREYNGKGTRSYMRAEFTDVNGDKQTADYRAFDLFMFGDRETTVLLRDVGLYEFVLNVGKTAQSGAWLGNYEFENSVQQFRITPYSIDLNDYNNLAWGLPDFGSALRDGGLYIYNGKPYMYEQQGMGAAERRNVVRSVARFRNVELNVGITVMPEALYGSGNQYTATLDGVCSAKEIGIYTAIATLKVKDGNYKFVYGLDVDLWSRGMKITLNADGTATVEKVWYIVGIDNGMLDADGNEYRIVGWTYGNDVTVAAPRLEHGDEADDYMSNSNIRFELIRNKVSVVKNLTRSNFAYYIN